MCIALAFGTLLPTAIPGVEQNIPKLALKLFSSQELLKITIDIFIERSITYPGVENLLLSEQTIISQVATNWQPAAVANPST